MSEQNKMITRRVVEALQSQGKLVLVDELVTGDYVGHTPFGEIRRTKGIK
jgi:hypothetical protein